MAESRLDLSKTARDKSIALLGPALAGATDLMLATKEAHWNVRGLNFAALHKLFDEFNADMGGYVDQLAERIIQVGGHAHGTLQAAAKSSTLPAYPEGLVQEKDHLKALAAQTSTLGALSRKGIDDANSAGDAATADLFTEITRAMDKWLWFIEANLA
jgi:starvation-inducible DNA-binding protein